MKIQVNSLEQTEQLAKLIVPKLSIGTVIALNGDLGAGKTTFVKSLVKHSGSKEIVTSPTFVLLNIYPGNKKFYHFDLYRLGSWADLENIGGEELIPPSDGIALIEWADKIPEILPKNYIHIDINFVDDTTRIFDITEHGKKVLGEIKWSY